MSAQPTEGVWRALPPRLGRRGYGDIRIVAGDRWNLVATLPADIRGNGEWSLEEAKANAQLIVASKDLVSALAAIAFDATGQHADPIRVLQHIAGQARAALAKVTEAAS